MRTRTSLRPTLATLATVATPDAATWPRSWALATAVVLLTGAACGSSTPATQLQTTVNVDATLQISSVEITANALGRPTLTKTFTVPAAGGSPTAAVEWQILIPTARRAFLATIEASGTSNGTSLVTDAQVWIYPAAKASVTLALTADCLGITCGAGKTCVAGTCDDIPVIAPPDASVDTAPDGNAGDGAAGDASAVDAPDVAQDSAAPDSGVQDAPGEGTSDAAIEAPTCDANGACKGTQGQTCPANGCVAGLTCVENVCCNSVCGSKCNSCLNANTGLATGTCGPVSAGLAHGGDCATTASTSCGTTGKCNGGGACALWPAGTAVAAATCPNGSTTATASRSCNGSGAAVGGATSSCGAYLCNSGAATCKSGACTSTAIDCSSGNFCSSTGCTAKKSMGQRCASSAECSTNVCGLASPASDPGCPSASCGAGGLCCAAGTTCSCPQPSAGEQLANPGFDANLIGWTTTPSMNQSGSVQFDQTMDSDGCPFSGSAAITTYQGDTSASISQCVPISSSSTYYFGAAMENGNNASNNMLCNELFCDLHWFEGGNCTGTDVTPVDGPEETWEDFQWVPFTQMGPLTPPPLAASAKVICYTSTPYTDSSCVGHFDKVYLSRSPAIY
jgi:hypothetical protein